MNICFLYFFSFSGSGGFSSFFLSLGDVLVGAPSFSRGDIFDSSSFFSDLSSAAF